MPNLTLTEVFGSGATFDGTAGTLTIDLDPHFSPRYFAPL